MRRIRWRSLASCPLTSPIRCAISIRALKFPSGAFWPSNKESCAVLFGTSRARRNSSKRWSIIDAAVITQDRSLVPASSSFRSFSQCSRLVCNISVPRNAALERLARSTPNKGYSPASPLQALVRRNGATTRVHHQKPLLLAGPMTQLGGTYTRHVFDLRSVVEVSSPRALQSFQNDPTELHETRNYPRADRHHSDHQHLEQGLLLKPTQSRPEYNYLPAYTLGYTGPVH